MAFCSAYFLVRHTLLQTLHTKKSLENSLVIITGDHSEALGEHRLYGHAKGLRKADIRHSLGAAELRLCAPALHDTRQATSKIDIAPTILHEFVMPIPGVWRGTPLQLPLKPDILYLQQG